MTDLSGLLAIANQAADIGRDLIRTMPAGALTSKGDRDMATEVDYAVEKAVRAFLSDRVPSIAILGEEEGVSGTEGRLLWALDPVDGTANFAHDMPLCAFQLGLIQDGRPVLGVIDLPLLNSRFSGAEGMGAFADGHRLAVRKTDQLAEAIVTIGDYSVGDGSAEKNEMRLAVTAGLAASVQRVRMFGSAAIDLAWLAAGKLDAVITLANNPWDMAPGVIIAREAGAVVTDVSGATHTQESATTVATVPGVSSEVLALLRDCLPSAE